MRILHFFIALLLATALTAQTEKRYALVIGNGDYAVAPLGAAPLNDARAMRDTLIRAGFEVSWRENRKLGEMNADIAEFARKIKGSGAVALFFYSGHGLQYEGRNFLVPIGADLSDEYDIDAKCVPAERLTAWMQDAGTPVNIVILNACRAYPVPSRYKDLRAGLAEMPRIPEMLIAYAAAPGAVADTRGEAGMSLFTYCLLQNMVVPGQTLEEVVKSTRRDVIARSGGAQRPEETSNLTYDFYFFPAAPAPPPVVSEKPAEPRPGPATVPVQPAATRCSYCPEMVFVPGTQNLPEGRYRMGSPVDDPDASDDERPAHPVAVPDFWIGKYEVTNREFVLFLNENAAKITFDDKGDAMTLNGRIIGEVFCGDKPGGCAPFVEMIEYDNGNQPGGEFSVLPGYESFPAVLVSWYGAKAYAAWLSAKTSRAYRLPAEAEWEYAARGGAASKGFKFAGSNNADEVAWTKANAGGKRQFKVGQKKPNELLLCDMNGNVWEWCENPWHDYYAVAPRNGSASTSGEDSSYRMLRGGSWFDVTRLARVAVRSRGVPDLCGINLGFRLARTP